MNVLIIGGGASGMAAALTAARQGHQVVLAEPFYNSSLFACVFFPKICLLRQKTGFKCPKFRQKNRKSAFAVLRSSIIYLFFVLFVV